MRKAKRQSTHKPMWVLVVLVLLGIGYLTFWSISYLGPLLHQETVTIRVKDKKAYTVNREVCELRGPQGGCVVSKMIVETSYSVTSTQEEFAADGKIYEQIVMGGQYEATVTGWYIPLSRREIVQIREIGSKQ